MAYAPNDRAFYDADSHIMELPDFLKKYADPDIREEVPEVSYSASLVTDEEVAIIMDQGGKHSEEHVAAQIAATRQPFPGRSLALIGRHCVSTSQLVTFGDRPLS